MVVRCREDGEVGETVEGDGVGRGGVAEAEGVAGDGAGRDRVGRLGTEEEAVAADDGVGGEGRSLEDVEEGPGVDARLAVDGGDVGRLALGRGEEVTLDVELEALGDLVLELDLGLQDVRGGPGLGEGDAVLDVGVLGLEVAGDGGRLGIAETGDLERDAVRRAGLGAVQVGVSSGELCVQAVQGSARGAAAARFGALGGWEERARTLTSRALPASGKSLLRRSEADLPLQPFVCVSTRSL